MEELKSSLQSYKHKLKVLLLDIFPIYHLPSSLWERWGVSHSELFPSSRINKHTKPCWWKQGKTHKPEEPWNSIRIWVVLKKKKVTATLVNLCQLFPRERWHGSGKSTDKNIQALVSGLLASPGVLFLLEGTDWVLIFVCLEPSKLLYSLTFSLFLRKTLRWKIPCIYQLFTLFLPKGQINLYSSIKHTKLSSVRTQGQITMEEFLQPSLIKF